MNAHTLPLVLLLLSQAAAAATTAAAQDSAAQDSGAGDPPLANASFEAAAGERPDHWRSQTWAGAADFDHAQRGRTGARSVAIASAEGADAAWYAVVPVRMHSTYRLSGWIRTRDVRAGGGRGALFNVHEMRSAATPAVTGTTDWTRVAVEFDTGVRTSVQINCLFGGWGSATGTAYFDDVALQRLSTEEWSPHLRIDAGAVGAPLSAYVYGQFIEHLGRCIQGGIWAELLEDRKFFDAVGAERSPWRAMAGTAVRMDRGEPFTGEHVPSVAPVAAGRAAGIVQGGLGLLAGREYSGRIWLAGSGGPVEVRLVWGDAADERDVVQVASPGAEFSATPLEFTCGADTEKGRFEIVSPGGGRFRVGAVSLMPADNVQGMRADVLALLRRLDAPVYRWPGGNFVSGYDWRDGVGERDRRPPRENPAWRGIESNDFGIDEFMTFCRVLDTEPYIAVNSGLGDVDGAVAQLEYVNGDATTPLGAQRARHGHAEPYGVDWWGIGNEMYGDWQLGHMPLEQYVDKHNRFAAAMRAVDPSIRLVAVGAVGRWSEGMLADCADHMDLISEHFYVQERRDVAAHVQQVPRAVRRIATAHRSYAERIPELAGRQIRVALDEWNYWYGPQVYGELGTRYFLKDALGIAAGLNEIARHSDLFFMANYAQTVNVIGCIKTTDTAASMATTGLVLELYRHRFGTLPVEVECSAPLDVMAALTADRRTLTVAALNPTAEALTVPLQLDATSLRGPGRLWRIAGDDPQAYNEPGRPPAVAVAEERIDERLEALELEPYSVTLLRLGLSRPVTVTEDAAAGRTRPTGANLAVVAEASASYVSGDTSLGALNDGHRPRSSRDRRRGAYGNWPRQGTQWVQYTWSQPIATDAVEVYWWNDRRGVRTPQACRLLYDDGDEFVPVPGAAGLGVVDDRFNVTTFDEVRTTRLRLEIDAEGEYSSGILEWRVRDSGSSPDFPPRVTAGVDRVVVLGGATQLDGRVQVLPRAAAAPVETRWRQVSGPGEVRFDDVHAVETTAEFGRAGDYVLELRAQRGELSGAASLRVRAVMPPPATHLEPVPTRRWAVGGPLWRERLKAVIVHWLPHCIERISDPDLEEGGLNNFVAAARKLAGEPHGEHRGYVFSNAWVFNTVEAICLALLLEPGGDEEIRATQRELRRTLDDWIPQILAAQEADGYLQTAFTLSERERWSPRHRGDHEGYVAGYFLEAAIAHRRLTGDPADRFFAAAKRLADCWVEHIGPPPRQSWYDGHQGLEIALLRFARFIDEVEGAGQGDRYFELGKFLLDERGGGGEYDQSHRPVTRQYEAVGHAVRAAYQYAAMADVAMETGDVAYRSAVASLWDNVVNRKYYVTGGIGSGESSEGFGPDYSLRHGAYCESCSSCGEILFQHRLNLTSHEARYADLYEETLYNALLGSLDLEGRTFYYQNPLETRRERYPWHVCPCCVGNIPRLLLQLPTWTYAKGADSIYVNLFAASTVTLRDIAGTEVRMVQETDHPWSGSVRITLEPREPREFSVHVRLPDRSVSELYVGRPRADGITRIAVDGTPLTPPTRHGYAVLTRTWQPGDVIEVELPMTVQRIHADPAVAATRGQVALRYGPLIYAVENVDQKLGGVLRPTAILSARWREDLLGGVVTVEGAWADGSPLLAIPYFARANRALEGEGEGEGGAERPRSTVWIDDR